MCFVLLAVRKSKRPVAVAVAMVEPLSPIVQLRQGAVEALTFNLPLTNGPPRVYISPHPQRYLQLPGCFGQQLLGVIQAKIHFVVHGLPPAKGQTHPQSDSAAHQVYFFFAKGNSTTGWISNSSVTNILV